MVWQETHDDDAYQIPDDIVDFVFRIQCKQLPLDHAHSLTSAILASMPWLKKVDQAAIHLIHVAESGNGWMRPIDNENEVLNLSKRTRFSIRIPKDKIEELIKLEGVELDIAGYSLVVGKGQMKSLVLSSTMFSRYIICKNNESEEEFMLRQIDVLKQKDILVKKMLCGRENSFNFPGKTIVTRSIMLADLERDDAIRLQQEGLGDQQKLGFGIFIPHKGVAPVVGKE